MPVAKLGWQAAVKSVGNSATTPRDLVCNEDAWLMLLILSESVAARLRELALRCTVVEISLRDTELNSFTRQQKIDDPISTSLELARTAFGLVRRNYHWSRPLRSIGVRASGLVAASAPMQLSLLWDETRREKRERLDRAVDGVRERYGYGSLQRARVRTDPALGSIDPTSHTIHPVGYFNGG